MSKYKTTWTELRQHMSEMELAYVVRYLDPKNGKRFAVPFKTQPDANKKRDQLKRDGAQQLSITKDYLKGKFKEDVSKDSAYAIGMAKAKDMYNDEPPVDKKTVTKAHDIAKAILRKEEFITEEQLIEQDKQDIQEFSRSQLDALARQYSDLKGKTISIDNANKLRKIFDKIPNHFLNDLRKKHIPFLSGLALSRMVQKGIPVKEDREIAEGFEWHTLSFLKRKGFNVARFSYGKLLVPKSDVEDVKKVLEKEYNKRDGDIFELPKKIVGESSFADLKHKSQPVEVREQFTTSQLTNLRKQWATVKTINPTGDKYKALVKWINDKEFKMVDQLARAKINFVSYIAKKALMDKWKFKKDTINKVYGGLLSNQYENLSLDKVFKEVSPPGWEGSVRAMKKHPELGGEDGKDGKNIYALAWYLKNKGAKSHYKDKGGKPVKKDKYKNEETEQHAQMISGVENEGRKETTNE